MSRAVVLVLLVASFAAATSLLADPIPMATIDPRWDPRFPMPCFPGPCTHNPYTHPFWLAKLHNRMTMMPVMPAMPTEPTEPAPALEAVPSLELVQSEDEALLADCREPGEPKEPSTQDLLQAICEFHKSILGQLTKIDHRMERLEERITKSKRRGSITSATSQSSHPQPSPSPSAKKLQVQGENLAMQALQMDISNLVPVRAARKSTATAIATASQSLGLGSWSLAGRQKQKDKRQKRLGQGEKSRDRNGNKESCIAEDRDDSDRRGHVPGRGSCVDKVQLAEGPTAKKAASRASPVPRKGSSGRALELPGILPIAKVGSEAFGPLESGSEAEVRPTATPQKSAEIEESGGAEVNVSKRPSSRGESPRNTGRDRVQGVFSFHSGGEPSPSSRNSRVNSSRSRRSSVSLHRAVSKANITEVFKVREKELTADLQKQQPNQRNLTPDRLDRLQRKKVLSVSSVVEVPEDAASQASQESSDESEASDADATEAKQVDEETDAELAEWEPFWLKLSPLNTFMTRHVSKALGLVPLFDLELEQGACSWRSSFKQLVSRLYHWSVLLLLLYSLVANVRRLSLCHSPDLFDEEHEELCGGSWPPLAVDMALLTGAMLVLVSWGGLFRYADTTRLVSQSAGELSSYCSQRGLDPAWKTWSCKDALWTLLLWVILVLVRFILCGWNSATGQVEFAEWRALLAHAILTGILVVASFWQVRTSHAMLLILNSWSASLLGGEISCMEAKQQWRRVSGLFRKTSRTFEHCFAALASLIVALALSALYDLRQGHGLEIVCGSAAIVFILPGVLWTHASTTTACNRLPSLVTLCEVEDEEEDAEYMDLAMYLSLSECGFFVWDTCVTVAFVQKFLYFASALAGTIGFQTGALKLT